MSISLPEHWALKPRSVFVVLALLLVVAWVWLAWTLLSARGSPPTAAPAASVARVNPVFVSWPGAGSLSQPYSGKLQGNPFHSTHIEKYLARVAAEKAAAEEAARKAAEEAARKAAEEAARKAAEEAARKAAAQQAAPGQPPPPPKYVDVVYRGMLQRADGERLALVEVAPPPSAQFYREGEPCRGTTVTGIQERTVALVFRSGTNETLTVNEPRKYLELQFDGR
jgi:hypothetical protein